MAKRHIGSAVGIEPKNGEMGGRLEPRGAHGHDLAIVLHLDVPTAVVTPSGVPVHLSRGAEARVHRTDRCHAGETEVLVGVCGHTHEQVCPIGLKRHPLAGAVVAAHQNGHDPVTGKTCVELSVPGLGHRRHHGEEPEQRASHYQNPGSIAPGTVFSHFHDSTILQHNNVKRGPDRHPASDVGGRRRRQRRGQVGVDGR